MGRRSRSGQQSGRFHVVNRGADRQTVFRDDADRVEFGRLVGESCERHGVGVVAYCLLDNHFHLVVDCPGGGLSPFVQFVSGVYTKHANERHGGDGPILRGRFFSRPILSDGYLLAAVRYVHRNPVAAGVVATPDSYRWSSHRSYLGLRQPPSWLWCSDVLRWVGGTDSFHQFVAGDPPSPATSTDTDALVDAIAQLVDEIASRSGSRSGRLARTASVLALDSLVGDARESLRRRLAFASTSAERVARRRARSAVGDRPWLASVVEQALALASEPAVHIVSDVK